MESWEFFIQKEGDRAWLPLESPEVEILEGRYRMVARSRQIDAPVEIRAIFQSSEEFPPKRKMQKRTTRTNAEGLMVVIPFTRLRPGIWDFTCFTDQTSQHSVRIEVLPIDVDAEVELQSSPDPASVADPVPPMVGEDAAVETEIAEIPIESEAEESAAPETEEIAASATESEEPSTSEAGGVMGKLYRFPTPEGLTGEVVTLSGATAESPATAIAPSDSDITVEASSSDRLSARQPLPPLQLTLDRETYMVKWGATFTLSGEIALVAGGELQLLEPLQFHIELQNPQTGEPVVEGEQSIAQRQLPMRFACAVEIPADCPTHLLLAEVTLQDSAGQELATRSFTIAADVDDLLGAIDSEVTEEQLLEYSRESIRQHQNEEIDASFEEILETIKKTQPLSFQPTSKEFLPPQIAKRKTRSPQAPKPLDLPSFPRPQPKPPEPAAAADPEVKAPAEQTETVPPAPPGEPTPEAKVAETIAPAQTEDAIAPPKPPSSGATASPVDKAFESLNLQDRFFSRLNALAGDRELSDWLKVSFAPVEDSEGESEETDNPFAKGQPRSDRGEATDRGEFANFDKVAATQEPIDWEAQEIVVDDELPDPDLASQSSEANPAGSLMLPKDEPVPTPVLVLPKGELNAGRSVNVAVRLPQILSRIYVKLWLRDRQNRTILDGPHWVTQFWPTGMGDVEGTRELMVPYGCLEVQFCCVAVEMQSQRESHKVSVDREISPPLPPTLPLDDL